MVGRVRKNVCDSQDVRGFQLRVFLATVVDADLTSMMQAKLLFIQKVAGIKMACNVFLKYSGIINKIFQGLFDFRPNNISWFSSLDWPSYEFTD